MELNDDLKLWLSENDYHDPIFVLSLGWYAFKGADVMPTCIHPYILDKEYTRQRVHPWIDLTEENS